MYPRKIIVEIRGDYLKNFRDQIEKKKPFWKVNSSEAEVCRKKKMWNENNMVFIDFYFCCFCFLPLQKIDGKKKKTKSSKSCNNFFCRCTGLVAIMKINVGKHFSQQRSLKRFTVLTRQAFSSVFLFIYLFIIESDSFIYLW